MNRDAARVLSSAVEEVEVGLQVQMRLTGVDPVIVGGHREETSSLHKRRERFTFD